jgi:Mn2+/Fe2+ NRAMP family transporter
LKGIKALVSDYGPAIFMIGAVLGTGSVSSLVVAGAEHGMSLLWALFLSCVFFWILVATISRLTFASGKTFVTLTREHFGRWPAFYVVVAVVVSQFTSNIGVLGIVSEAFASWANVDFLTSSFFWCSAVYLLIFFGKFSVFERALAIFVSLLGLSFILNMFLAQPSASEALSGLVPGVPDGGAMIVGAMVGTTLAGPVIVMRSFVVLDKGWKLDNLRHANRDAIVSGLLVFLVSAAVMACAAATLHVRGLHVDRAIDMAYTLVPLLGQFAATLFVIGIMAAGLSSAFPNALVSIWTISDFFRLSRDPRALHFRLLAVLFCGAGLIAPVFGGKPVFLQIISLGVQVIFLPILVLFILILVNKSSVVGRYQNSRAFNLAGIITFLFSLFMAYQAFMGLSEVVRMM